MRPTQGEGRKRALLDVATCIGLGLAALLVVAVVAPKLSLTAFVDLGALLLVAGGMLAALFIQYPLEAVLGLPRALQKCFHHRLPDVVALQDQIAELAAVIRRDGLLAVEKRLPEIEDRLLARGLEFVVAGVSRETLRASLEAELSRAQERDAVGKTMLEQLGAIAPAFGLIGTLVGLVQMLRNLDDLGKIASAMSVALLTTLYASLGANLICLPLAGKLDWRAKEERLVYARMIDALEMLLEGESPSAIKLKLGTEWRQGRAA